MNKLDKVIDWEIFRTPIEEALYVEPKAPGGRPPFDILLMFKILILQKYYNLSDEQTEFQIKDRLSFMQFLGLQIGDTQRRKVYKSFCQVLPYTFKYLF